MAASAADVVEMARQYLGTPYVFGGTDPKRGLDCSSLVQLVYKNLGYGLPRLVRDQRNQGSAVNGIKNAQPGDLLVFGTQPSNYHIGIYLGGNKVLHAPQPGEKVKISNVWTTPTTIRRIVGAMPGGNTADYSSGTGGAGQAAKLSLDTLASNYGYSAAFFKSDPTLWKLINQATTEQWTQQEFEARIKGTKWYQTYGDTYRKWRVLEHSDPGTAAAKMTQTRADLTNRLNKAGITVDPKRLTDMVWRVNAYGWDDSQVSDAIAAEMKFDPKKVGNYTGEMAANESKIKATAAAYGVDVSDQTIFNFEKSMVGQDLTEEGMTEYFKKQAKSKYAGLADDIDAGQTVAEYANPFMQSQARLLEVDPADVHLEDPHIQAALQNKDVKTGVYTPLSMYDFEKRVKSDPRWMKTKNGRDDLMDGARQVMSDWGLAGIGGGNS